MADRLALHDAHVAAGAVLEAPCGVLLPFSYGDPAGEYDAVRRATGLIDHGHAGVLEVTGRDRAAFLHAMLSNDVTSLRPGQGCAATLLDIHGKVQVIVTVWALEDRVLLLTPPGLAARTMEDLDRYLFSEKAYFRDATGELALLILAGPGAPDLATRLTGTSVPGAAWSHATGRIGDAEVRLVRGGGETGGDEVWIAAAAAEGARVWQAARDAGARPVGVRARESLRIEAGTPLYGHDVDASVLLPEIPHEALVSHTKGCYLGQEVVVRIRDRGHVNRHLRGLVVDGEEIPAPGAAVLAGDVDAGKVTSAAWSHGLKRPIALGFIRRQHADPGTVVAISAGERRLAAVVSVLPFGR